MHVIYVYFLLLLFFSSCGINRNLVYFRDAGNNAQYQKTTIENTTAPRIEPNDLLSIWVSSLNPEFNVLFNAGMIVPAGTTNPANIRNSANDGYLVDMNGEITFPVIGKIALAGLTKKEAIEKISLLLQEYVKDPIVNMRFMNFRVSVIGEVNNPSTFTVPSESINLLEALALAGDLTVFGRRENVLIIREKDGLRTTTRVSLEQKDLLNSPYFHLEKNDIVYVEPHSRHKIAQTDPNSRFIPIIVSAISALAIFLTTVNR